MTPQNVLILPGLQGSGTDHWQSRWERAYGFSRVEQHDWMRPLRGDWIARLEDVLLSRPDKNPAPVVLVAHSLGCLLVAAWAAHSKNTHHVQAALLVAPPDTERADVRQLLPPGWAPIPAVRLPFQTVMVISSNDPFCAAARARDFAGLWGAKLVEAGARGHLNADSGLGDWPEAYAQLEGLMAKPATDQH